MSFLELAMLLEISPPSVWTYLERGEGIARGNGYWMIEYFFIIVPLSHVKHWDLTLFLHRSIV